VGNVPENIPRLVRPRPYGKLKLEELNIHQTLTVFHKTEK